jgi:Serine aminopeptidase, S33
LKYLLFLLGMALAGPVSPQEIVTVQTRPGVTQSFFVANMGKRKPQAAALLFAGGGGSIKLRTEGGQIRFNQGNFLPRERREFIRNGILPLLLDNSSDQQAGDGMNDGFRASRAHAADIRVVVGAVKKRYPGLPLFLVGTSRGTVSVAYLAVALDGDVAGAILTSSLFYEGPQTNPRPVLAGFGWSAIKMRVLLVHHAGDNCFATPYHDAARLEKRYPLVTVHGGKPSESGPCEPFSPHGFFGKEPETVDAIAAWMLGKPFAKEIK